jgi:hypothetical protein
MRTRANVKSQQHCSYNAHYTPAPPLATPLVTPLTTLLAGTTMQAGASLQGSQRMRMHVFG